MLKNFDPFDMLIGMTAALMIFTVAVVSYAMFEADILHWAILILVACYCLGKFIRERTGI